MDATAQPRARAIERVRTAGRHTRLIGGQAIQDAAAAGRQRADRARLGTGSCASPASSKRGGICASGSGGGGGRRAGVGRGCRCSGRRAVRGSCVIAVFGGRACDAVGSGGGRGAVLPRVSAAAGFAACCGGCRLCRGWAFAGSEAAGCSAGGCGGAAAVFGRCRQSRSPRSGMRPTVCLRCAAGIAAPRCRPA